MHLTGTHSLSKHVYLGAEKNKRGVTVYNFALNTLSRDIEFGHEFIVTRIEEGSFYLRRNRVCIDGNGWEGPLVRQEMEEGRRIKESWLEHIKKASN